MKYSQSINSMPSLLVHVFVIPLFLLLSVLLYEVRPLCDLLHAGEGISTISNIYPFNIAIVFTIVIGSMLICRLSYYFLRKRVRLSLSYYAAWCVMEIVVCSAFVALYVTLISRGQFNYFVFLGRSFRSLSTLMVYPYVIIYQSYYILDLKNNVKDEDDVRIKFYDNRKLLKFTTTAASVLYIQAAENYIDIYYMENGKVKLYELRNSMKNIEQLCAKCGFVRVHRSYLVNPANVRSVAKASEGRYFATMNASGVEDVPVSKKYYQDIVSQL